MPIRPKKSKLQRRLPLIAKKFKNFKGKRRERFLHETAIVTGVIVVIVMIAQVVYPADRTLPFTKVADIEIGSLTKREAIEYLFQSYSSVNLTVSFANRSIETTTDRAGVLVDFQKAADAAARYPWWQRLIPFSLFYKSLVINARPEITLDGQLAEQFINEVKQQCDIAVQEAVVSVERSEVILKKGADGQRCGTEAIKEALSASTLRHQKATTSITPEVLHPKKTNAIATGQFERAKAIIGSGLAIKIADKEVTVPKEILAQWVVFIDDPVKHTYDVGLNESVLLAYLQSLKGDVYAAPFPTNVHTLDGRETYREIGRPGRDIDYGGVVADIKRAFQERKASVVTAKIVDVSPPLNYLHNYSQSQLGLERLLRDLVASKGNYAITVTELGGMGRSAGVNGERMYVNASTYKLFVVYFVLKDLELGKLKWDDVITGGLNVRQCFEEMIVRSANRCALAYIARYGADTIVNKMHELGFKSVEHNSTWWATPNDMALYLKKLERGELLDGESREFLLGLLKRQVWRYGIPSGIPGLPIADKVGFLEDYIHDLAIVYSPKGTYVLAIMTKGGSYAGMADVARQVHRYLNQ